MSCRPLPSLLTLVLVGFGLCATVSPGRAADAPQAHPSAGGAMDHPRQEVPAVAYETEGDYSFGYGWVSNEDSLKAAEYLYPRPSATFSLNLLSCPLPYRYHVNAEFLNREDFYTDAGFAYKDLILFRDILIGAHQNRNHYPFQYLGEPPTILYAERDAGEVYDTGYVSNLSLFRLKAPDYPWHTFVSHRHVEQNGRVQQRFLLGTFEQINKVSESRETNWRSDALRLGTNSHAGPVEIEYAFDLAEFSPGPDHVLYDTYLDTPNPASSSFRPGDRYPHNVLAETESAAHTVKLHSSYTGGVVAAATMSNLYQQNNYSQTNSSTSKGAFDFSWIPDPAVGLFFKYRHKDVALDTPQGVTLTGLSHTLNYAVRQGIASDRDLLSLSTRYRPLSIVTLFATYEFTHLTRNDVDEWVVLPAHADIHTVNFTAQAKPLAQVKVKAGYEYKNYTQPSYNNTPDTANKLRLTTTYTPAPWLNCDLEYILSVTKRDSLRYLSNAPGMLLETGEREGRSDQFLASLSTPLSGTVSLSASWFYQRWDVEQDLAYRKWLSANVDDLLFYLDTDVPYSDQSNSFALAVTVVPRQDLTVGLGLTYTINEGDTGYEDVVGGAPYSLYAFSALKATETILSFEVTKKLSPKWEFGLKSNMGIYNDRAYSLLDGTFFTTVCNFKRYL